MKRIWKFKLTEQFTELQLKYYGVVHVGHQDGAVTIWVLVGDDPQEGRVKFRLVMTGEDFPEGVFMLTHLGTVQLPSGYVVHVFQDAT